MKSRIGRRREEFIPPLVGLVGAALLLAGGSIPLKGLWAFRFLTYVNPALRMLMAALVLAIALPPLQQFAARLRLPRLTLRPWLLIPASGLAFWLFRERTFHGDALLKLELLQTHTLQTDPYVWKEPLDGLLGYSTTALLGSFGLPPETAIAGLSVLAGMVYVAAALGTSRLLGRSAGERAVLFLGLLALGSSQLWFGHVENYSLVTAFSFASVTLALGYLAGRVPLWLVGLTAGAAVSLHPQALFSLPALLLLLDRQRWPQQMLTLVSTTAIMPLLTVGILVGMGVPLPSLDNGYAGDPQLFWTPAQALAPSQLVQALNNLWLVAPFLPALLMAGALALLNPSLRGERTFRYLTGAAAGMLLYHFSFQNDLPRPQDWDLFAIVGPFVTVWGLHAWLSLEMRRGERHRVAGSQEGRQPSFHFPTPILPALAFALAITACWVGVSHSYTLLRPNPDQRRLYRRYQLLDLTNLLPQARITPATPICDDPASDPTGCRRVTLTRFTMPQDGDERPVIFAHAPARIGFSLQVPAQRSFLWLSPALDPLAWRWGGDGVTFQVWVRHAGKEELLWERHLTPANPGDLDWQEAFIPLDDYRDQVVTLLLVTTPGPAGNDAADRAGWGLPWLMRGTVDEYFH